MEINEIRKQLKKILTRDRYEHTKGVMYTAGCLAMAYEYPIEKAMMAGLLHDCAKCIPYAKQISLCNEYKIPITSAEYESPYLLHAKLGAYFAENQYEVTDREILHAICVHTTGAVDMGLLDKILFVADYIEPKRDKAQNLQLVRKLAFCDLDCCITQILQDTLKHLARTGGPIDPTTQTAYEYYKQHQKGN